MSCLEVWTSLRLGWRRKEKGEKEGEEYIDFYWKFEAAREDEVARTLTAKNNASKRKRLPAATSGVKKFEDIYAWLQSQHDPKTGAEVAIGQNGRNYLDCERGCQIWREGEDEDCQMIMIDPRIGSYSPKKAEALYLRRLSRPEKENYDPRDPYTSFFFPSRSQQTRSSTLPLFSSSSSSSLQSISSLSTLSTPPTSLSITPSSQSSTPLSIPSSLSSLV